MNPKNILITGASGLIGTRLTAMLVANGHRVAHLSRSAGEGTVKTFLWDVQKMWMDAGALSGVDTIVHLAGAGIADKPWTPERKREILDSRTHSTRLLYETLKANTHSVKHFVSASAIGYYGFHDNNTVFTEANAPGVDFLADVVKQWEAEADRVDTLGTRVVKIRTGIVLSEKGGALKEMANPVRYYVGAPLGTGKQNISWIHLDDLCAIFVKAVEDESLRGPYNATGPYAVTNRDLTKSIARVLGKPLILPPVPAFILKLMLGEMANLVLTGSKVSSEKIQRAGFTFRFGTLEEALKNLLGEA